MSSTRDWQEIKAFEDIRFEFSEGIARITIDRQEVYNAFRPETNMEMLEAMDIARERTDIGVVVLTGAGDKAFCSGGDQNVKGTGGYIGNDGVPRLNVLDLHKKIRSLPKPVIAAVNGYAIGGGHVLHVVCDLTIASDNAIFGQTGPKVGSFDAGFGSSYLARHVGQKKAREIWFLCEQYSAAEAENMGLVNTVVPLERLEETYVKWCKTIMKRSPLALRMIKRGLNAELDGQIVRIPGYALPLEHMDTGVKELLLVPYVGACIHVPPPPANQIVYVTLKDAYTSTNLYEPVWITGRMTIETTNQSLTYVDGTAGIDTAYTLKGEKVERYAN